MRFAAMLLLLFFTPNALAAPLKCAVDDSPCLIQSLTDEVIQRQYLEKKLEAVQKEKTLTEQYAEEQKKRADSNENRFSRSTWFFSGVVGGLIISGVIVLVKGVAAQK